MSNGLFHAAQEIQSFLLDRQYPFCFIGGMALMRWGQPRMTQDVDVSLYCEFGEEEPLVRDLLSRFNSRIDDAETFALDNRILLLRAGYGTPVDVALASLPFEQQMMQHATMQAYAPDCSLRICSAEDLIVMKAFANRPQDWADVEGIMARQGKSLKMEYVFESLEPLAAAKEMPEIVEKTRNLAEQQDLE